MAMQVINSLVNTIDEARQRGHDVWDLFLLGFASGDEVVTFADFAWPELGKRGFPTIYGVTIGNRSHIDRCVLLWDPGTTFRIPPVDGLSPYDFMRRVSVHHPLIFSQQGNERTTFIDPSIGAVRVAGEVQTFGSTAYEFFPSDMDTVNRPIDYIPVGAAAPVVIPWSDELAVNKYVNPILHLQFLLRPPSQVPYLRHPFRYQVSSNVTAAAGETIIAMMPIFGRRRLRIQLVPAALGVTTATVRIGGFFYRPALTAGQEFNLATGAIAAGAPVNFQIDEPNADWLTVYVTSTVGTGQVETHLFAVD